MSAYTSRTAAHPGGVLRSYRALLAGAVVGSVLLAGCAPQDGLEPEQEGSAAAAPEETESAEKEQPTDPASEDDQGQEEEPEYALSGGFWRANTLPDPVAEAVVEAPQSSAGGERASAKMQVLSLDRDGDYARLVLAWLQPEDGEWLRPDSLRALSAVTDPDKPWVRLVDREAGELIEPLRTDGQRSFDPEAEPEVEDTSGDFETASLPANCICSSVTSGSNEAGSRTYLIYVDFPAPESDEVDVLAGQWVEPLKDVPVSEGEPFELPEDGLSRFVGQNSELPAIYGADARYQRITPLTARSRSLTGVTTVIDGDTQEVTLPSDVLFEFGEHTLTDEAQSIIEDAAQKLNAEAAGQTVVIEGHTDNVDGHDVNQPLSENRAQAVAEVIEPLLDEGITIETEGHSFNRPLVPNEDADGNDLPENRALNRRVSFRYTVVEEDSGTEIDLGYEEIEELPEAEETQTAEGALASYLLDPPEDDPSDLRVRFDILDAARSDDGVMMRFAIATPEDEEYDESAFSHSIDTGEHFGPNPYFSASLPTAANISLVDDQAGEQHFPVSAGPLHCLCTEVAADGPGLGPQPSPLFAEFQLPENLQEGQMTIRIAESNQFQMPQAVLERLGEETDQ